MNNQKMPFHGGENIKKLRVCAGFTKATALARATNHVLSAQRIRYIEKNNSPLLKTIEIIALTESLNCSVSALMLGENGIEQALYKNGEPDIRKLQALQCITKATAKQLSKL